MSAEKIEGGFSGGVDELYREVILDHFKSPKNRGALPTANGKADGTNPLCGDQLTLSVQIENNAIKDIRFEGHGCAISQSAASMMTETVKGKSLEHVRGILNLYKKMFGVETKEAGTAVQDDLGDLLVLEGVKKYPVRIKCALLSGNTLLQSIEDYLNKRGY